ncbi:unnamed protein product, partial [Allacma fusca]
EELPQRAIITATSSMSSKLIREVYGKAVTSGRPKLETFIALNGDRGIALQDGQGWKEHRVRRHFIDVYLEELDNRKLDVESSFSETIGDENLVVTCRDLFFAGSETMSATLSWMCLYLALNPEIQKKSAS